MKIPTARLVFDRKHNATPGKCRGGETPRRGAVQIEVLYKRQRKWIGTGVKLYADQWDANRWVVQHSEMFALNDSLRKQLEAMERWLFNNFSTKEFSWDALKTYVDSGGEQDSFLLFVEKMVEERNDIRESSRRVQRKLLTMMYEFKGLRHFSDITPAGVLDFDNFLHGRKVRKLALDGREEVVPLRQSTVFSYHKTLKTYIHMAMARGYVKADPYAGLRFKRGESEPDRYLSEEELHRIETGGMRSGSVARARDMFLFQCYTGLAYADLRAFDFAAAERHGDGYVYSGRRVKTGEPFFFLLLPKAMEILEKYGYRLPVTGIEGYNRRLKTVAKDAGVGKPIASHWGRRTAAMVFLNKGIRLETVAKILGHSDVATTQAFYAQISKETVADEMGGLLRSDGE